MSITAIRSYYCTLEWIGISLSRRYVSQFTMATSLRRVWSLFPNTEWRSWMMKCLVSPLQTYRRRKMLSGSGYTDGSSRYTDDSSRRICPFYCVEKEADKFYIQMHKICVALVSVCINVKNNMVGLYPDTFLSSIIFHLATLCSKSTSVQRMDQMMK